MYTIARLFVFSAVAVSGTMLFGSLAPDGTIHLIEGDIVHQRVDAIVNAANNQLAGGGGVCGAIFRAAGPQQLQQACDAFPLINGVRCPVGQARITPSFNLQSQGIRNIIHAVGPDCRVHQENVNRNPLLRHAYTRSLQAAERNHLTSVAFPSISTGIFGYPANEAVEVAIEAVRDYFLQTQNSSTSIRDVYFIVSNPHTYALFQNALRNHHPPYIRFILHPGPNQAGQAGQQNQPVVAATSSNAALYVVAACGIGLLAWYMLSKKRASHQE